MMGTSSNQRDIEHMFVRSMLTERTPGAFLFKTTFKTETAAATPWSFSLEANGAAARRQKGECLWRAMDSRLNTPSKPYRCCLETSILAWSKIRFRNAAHSIATSSYIARQSVKTSSLRNCGRCWWWVNPHFQWWTTRQTSFWASRTYEPHQLAAWWPLKYDSHYDPRLSCGSESSSCSDFGLIHHLKIWAISPAL